MSFLFPTCYCMKTQMVTKWFFNHMEKIRKDPSKATSFQGGIWGIKLKSLMKPPGSTTPAA